MMITLQHVFNAICKEVSKINKVHNSLIELFLVDNIPLGSANPGF